MIVDKSGEIGLDVDALVTLLEGLTDSIRIHQRILERHSRILRELQEVGQQ